MNPWSLAPAGRITRDWTRLYTAGLPAAAGEQRRGEIVRSGAVPRALAIPAAVGVVTFVWAIGPIGAAGWRVSMVGVLAVAASFVLTAGWLTLRGTRRPSQKALTSPADELPGEDIE